MEQSKSRPIATDALIAGGAWVVGERYGLHEGIDRFRQDRHSWLPFDGQPDSPDRLRDGQLVWFERDRSGQRIPIPDARRGLRPDETRVHVLVDESPDPRSQPPRVWVPSERTGLADELAGLATQDDAAIVAWVKANGFVGVRADPRERQESVEEIRWGCRGLAVVRGLVRAIRERRGDELRAEVERLLVLPEGLLTEFTRDHQTTWEDAAGHHERAAKAEEQPWGGLRLARSFGISVPDGQRWPGAGAYLQAMYLLSEELSAPLRHLLRVQASIVPTGDGMRLQTAIVARGPLATAYLQTLDEASWPAIAYAGDVLRVDWRAPRRCGRCQQVFRPVRRAQRWCGPRCRWAASKAAVARRDAHRQRLKPPTERAAPR